MINQSDVATGIPQYSLAKFAVLFPIGFPQEMRSVARIIYCQTTCCTGHRLFSYVALYLHCGRKLIFNKCADKSEQQDAGNSLTLWSAYLVLFRLNVTLHHRVSQPICDTVCSDIMAISIHLVFIQIRADKQTSPVLRHTLNASENLLLWKFHQQYEMLELFKYDKIKLCCGDYTVEQNVCISLVSVQYSAYFL